MKLKLGFLRIFAFIAIIGFLFAACDNGSTTGQNQTPVIGDYTIGNLNQTAVLTSNYGRNPMTFTGIIVTQTPSATGIHGENITATNWTMASWWQTLFP